MIVSIIIRISQSATVTYTKEQPLPSFETKKVNLKLRRKWSASSISLGKTMLGNDKTEQERVLLMHGAPAGPP